MSTSQEVSENNSENNDKIEKWKRVIKKMTFNQIVLLEYCTESNSTFRKMFPSSQNSYTKSVRCNLCETATMTNFPSLTQHIQGKKHLSKVDSVVKEFKHPIINPFKIEAEIVKIEKEEPEMGKVNDSKVVINPLSITADLKKGSTEPKTDAVLNKETLKENMAKMVLSDLLLIEYRFINTNWQKLFEQKTGIFVCSMCKSTPLPHLSAIKQHMNERKHQTNMDLVKGLYHPKYSPIKDEGNPENVSTIKQKENISSKKSSEGNKTKEQSNENKQDGTELKNKSLPESTVKDINEISSSSNHSQQTELITTSKQQSLTNVFRTKMLALNLDDLKKIEYRYSKGPWKKMLIQNNSNQIKCMLCNVVIIQSLGDIKQHIAGKKHQLFLDSIILLYHPVLANTKLEGQKPKLIENKEDKTIVPSTSSQSPQPEEMKSPVELKSSDEKPSSEESSSSKIQNENQTEKSTSEKTDEKPSSEESSSSKIQNENQTEKLTSDKTDEKPSSEESSSSKIQNKNQTEKSTSEKTDEKPSSEESSSSKIHNKNQTEKSTTDKRSNNKGRIVCTIELEDSPEREIGKIVKNEESACVINPAAIMAQNTLSSVASKKDDNRSNQENKNADCGQHSSSYIRESTIPVSNNQSLNIIKKSQENQNQRRNQDIEFGNFNQVQFSLQSNNGNKSSFSTKMFSSKVENDVEGLIGVEYVIKILRSINDNSPRYECCLCEVEVDGFGMQLHLKGLHHRMKYLERHFPTAMREFSQYKNKVNMSSVMAQIVEKLAIAIEQYHGRDLPYECLHDEFRSNRHSTMSKVFSFKHASEINGPSFTDVVDKNAIDEFISKKDTYKSLESGSKRKTFDVDHHSFKRQKMTSPKLDVEEHKRLVEKFLENTNRANRYGSSSKKRRSRSRSRSPSFNRYNSHQRRSRSPILKDRQLGSRSRGQDRDRQGYNNDIWQKYRRQFDRALEKLGNQYKKYRNDPETHPRYDDEWKQFWARRTNELIAEGRDPSSYNFQPEWVKFFIHRMDELYEEAVEDLRVNLRKELGLELESSDSMQNRFYNENRRIDQPAEIFTAFQNIPSANVYNNPINVNQPFTMGSSQDQRMYYNPPVEQMHQTPPQMQQIHQIPPQVQYPKQATQSQKRHYQPHPHSHPQASPPPQQQQQQKEPQKLSEVYQESRQPQRESNVFDMNTSDFKRMISSKKDQKNLSGPTEKKNRKYDEMDIDPEAITPVSVLRILTALEEQLGSLGPKVIDLLSKALTLEKAKPNKSSESFLTTENCVFLETVREKLRGQLLAGVVENNKIKAIKKAIKDITALLDIADEYIENESLKAPEPPTFSSITTESSTTKSPSSPNVDKRELASKLAAALAAQGRTDFTTEQLEQLVTVYSMINKKTQKDNATTSQTSGYSRHEEQQQKSLSDTLADLMKTSSSTAIKQTTNNGTSQETYPKISKLLSTSTSIPSSQSQNQPSISKPSYNFGMLSNFDTSLKFNEPSPSTIRPSSSNQSSRPNSFQNATSGSSANRFSNVNQTPNTGNDWTRNRPSGSNTFGQQPKIPPLIPNLSYNQNRHGFDGNQSMPPSNSGGAQERSISGNRTMTRPNNQRQNFQGGGFDSQNNSSRQPPMGWNRQFGRKF